MKKYAISILIALCTFVTPSEAQTNVRRFVTVDETGGNVLPGNFWSVNGPLIQGQLTNFPAGNISGVLPLSKGGTGASNSAGAIQSLGLGSAALSNASAFQSASPTLSNLSLGIGASLSNIPVSGVSGLQSALDGKLSIGATLSISNITGLQSALNGKLNTNGTLPISNVVGLQTALDGKMPVNAGITNIFGLQTALNGKLDANGTLPIANVTGLQAALDSKLSSAGTLSIGNITGLQAALDGKLNPSSTLQISNIFGLQSVLDQKLGAGANLAISNVTGLQTALDGKLSTTASIPLGSVSGLQSALDGKLGANSSIAISNVSGLAGALDGKLPVNGTLSIANITGLQGALDQKFNTNGVLPITSISGLQAALDLKLDGSSTIQLSNVFGLQSALNSKLDATSSISILNIGGLQAALDGKLGTNGVLPIGNISGLQAELDSKLSSTNFIVQITNVFGLSTALSNKLDVTGTLPISSITGLGDALAGKMPTNQTFGIPDINGLALALSNKLDVGSGIPISSVVGLNTALSEKLSSSNPFIPSITNVFGLVSALANKRETTNPILISEVSNLQAALDGKLDTNSLISAANVTGLQALLDAKVSTNAAITTLSGTLPISRGGTGSTNATNARQAILPSYSGNAAKVLALNSNASDVEWIVYTNAGGGGGTGAIDLSTTNATGILPIVKGGSGSSSAAGARANFLPSYSGNATRLLAVNSNSSDVEWITFTPGLSSVDLTSTNVSGVLPLLKGGTGGSNSASALLNLLPSYSGNANKVLSLDATGTNVVWTTVSGGGGSSDLSLATGVLSIAKGGTGGTNTSAALANLSILPLGAGGTNDSLQLGRGAVATNTNSVAFTNAIALGNSANALTNSAIQIGTGTNTTVNTVQFFNWGVVDTNEWNALSASTDLGRAILMAVTNAVTNNQALIISNRTNATAGILPRIAGGTGGTNYLSALQGLGIFPTNTNIVSTNLVWITTARVAGLEAGTPGAPGTWGGVHIGAINTWENNIVDSTILESNAPVVIGYSNRSSSSSVVIGSENDAYVSRSAVVIGQSNTPGGIRFGVTIGRGNSVIGSNSVAIGRNNSASNGSTFRTIAIGSDNNSTNSSQDWTAIGVANTANWARSAVLLGSSNSALGSIDQPNTYISGVALGNFASIRQTNFVDTANVFQFGPGTNSVSNSIQFMNAGVMDTNEWSALANSTVIGRNILRVPTNGATGQVLAVDSTGTNVAWTTVSGGGGGTLSVDLGSANATGVLPVLKGGTGATNEANAIQNLLPAYSGNADRSLVLNSNATALEWRNLSDLASTNITGILPVSKGGTGATNAYKAMAELGVLKTNSGGVQTHVTIGTAMLPGSPMTGDPQAGLFSVAIGYGALATHDASVAIGLNAKATNNTAAGSSIAIGDYAEALAAGAVQIGYGTNTNPSSISWSTAGNISFNEWGRLAALSTYPSTNLQVVTTAGVTNTLVISNGIIVNITTP